MRWVRAWVRECIRGADDDDDDDGDNDETTTMMSWHCRLTHPRTHSSLLACSQAAAVAEVHRVEATTAPARRRERHVPLIPIYNMPPGGGRDMSL